MARVAKVREKIRTDKPALALQAAQPASVLVVEPNRFTWPQAETQAMGRVVCTGFFVDSARAGSSA